VHSRRFDRMGKLKNGGKGGSPRTKKKSGCEREKKRGPTSCHKKLATVDDRGRGPPILGFKVGSAKRGEKPPSKRTVEILLKRVEIDKRKRLTNKWKRKTVVPRHNPGT